MDEANAVTTPCVSSEKGGDNKINTEVPHKEAVGSLMYLSAATRPDIAFAVSKAARAMENPTQADWNAVKRIFRYLRGTSDFGIMYKRNGNQLEVYSDADFAGDVSTRRSTTGVISMYADGPISWSSHLQRTVALSTTEAEIIAASEGAKELVWLKRLLKDLSLMQESPVLLSLIHI